MRKRLVVVVAMLAVCAACGSNDGGGSSQAAGSSSSTTTSSPAAAAAPSQFPGDVAALNDRWALTSVGSGSSCRLSLVDLRSASPKPGQLPTGATCGKAALAGDILVISTVDTSKPGGVTPGTVQDRQMVSGIDLTNGQVAWAQELPTDLDSLRSSPDGAHVAVVRAPIGSDAVNRTKRPLVVLDPRTGQRSWESTDSMAAVWFAGDVLVAGAQAEDPIDRSLDHYVGFDLAGGKQLWSKPLAMYASCGTLSLAVGPVSQSGSGVSTKPVWFDAKTGELGAQVPVGTDVFSASGVSPFNPCHATDSRLFFGGSNGLGDAKTVAANSDQVATIRTPSGGRAGVPTGAYTGAWVWGEDDGTFYRVEVTSGAVSPAMKFPAKFAGAEPHMSSKWASVSGTPTTGTTDTTSKNNGYGEKDVTVFVAVT